MSLTPDTQVLARLAVRSMESTISVVGRMILSTPTGDDRNAITDANIHLEMAQAILRHLGAGESGVPPSLSLPNMEER